MTWHTEVRRKDSLSLLSSCFVFVSAAHPARTLLFLTRDYGFFLGC